MKHKLLFTFLLFTTLTFSQQEASNWYFGSRAGIKFLADGSVTTFPNSAMTAQHGCATISDANGNLLFYSNGEKIWNKNHQVMSNGDNLLGSIYSTQSVFILKKPGSSHLYYVFTLDILSGNNGFRYSEVDMNLDSGLGAVTTTKDVLLYTPSSQKIAVVNHTNGVDYWVVTHGWKSNVFYSHLVTASGISAPIMSNAGSVTGDGPTGTSGEGGGMKISPDGSKLAICNPILYDVELFDFNTTSGKVSNGNVILSESYVTPYSVEFSSNSKVLYASLTTNGILYQFDLNSANIASSKIEIAKTYFNNGDLQLGINNKIYLTAFFGNDKLSVINNPDILGLGCDFQFNSVQIPGTQFYGLPVFCASIFNQFFSAKKICLGNTTEFSLTNTQSVVSSIWNFGDGGTSTDINPTHTYTNAGIYTVSVSVNGDIPKTSEITISSIPRAAKPQDILICDDNNDGLYSFDLTTQNVAILNGQDSNLYTVTYLANNVAILSPTTYINSVAYQKETITAEVSNKANGECKSTTTFTIGVFDTPLPNLPAAIPNLSSCDNTSFGTDNDGKVVFDLTQRATTVLNGQSATQFLLSYYKDAGLTQAILNPRVYQNTNPKETIYVKMVNKDNPNCFATTSFKIEVFALPTITAVVDLKQCDDDIDGFSTFNLEEAISKITANASVETIAFFKTAIDAQNNVNPISNPTNYINKTVSIDKVFARVTNANGCFRVAQVNLIVSTTQIPLTFKRSFTQCDDAVSGSNTDGIASFDFSNVTNQIQSIFPVGQQLDITYYRNLSDALAEKNAIPDISNYRNIGYPNTQNIYIRVDSRLNNDCLGLGSHITLTVESIPVVQSMNRNHCDDDQDGLYAFDTSAIQNDLLNGLANVTVSYFDQNNNQLPSPLPNPFLTGSQMLKVVVKNNTSTACSFDTTLEFIVDDLPEAFPISPSLITVCDDETDPALQDGKYAFDTSGFQATILGGQTGMTVNYFDDNNNVLSSPLPNPFITATQNITVEVVNPVNSSCNATIVIPFVVNPLPRIQLAGDELVCSDLPTFTKIIDAGLLDESQKNSFNYTWTLDGNPILDETNYDLTVNEKGIYKVETSNSQGCSMTRTITVNASDKATVEVNIVDLSSENSITVLATGAGDYVFSLDNENGDYQNNNVFNNVPAGIHTVFVKDLNGCGIVPKEVALLGIPNYFTPNQDGYNDTWNIKGVNSAFNAKTIVRIFDRYGKLLKETNPEGDGWDGTYIGQHMPATDYWYSIQLQDGRIFKGHFALKR